MPIDEYVTRIVRPTAIWPRIFPVSSSSGDTADKITSIVRLDFSSIVVVNRYCPLLITEIISRMVNPIGNSPAKSARVADSPVGGDGHRRRARHFGERVDALPIQSRRAHARIDDRFGRRISNLVLNAVVEVPPHEQVVGAEDAFVVRRRRRWDGRRARQAGAVAASLREPLLLLVQARTAGDSAISRSGSSPRTARCAAAPPAPAAAPAIGLDSIARLNDASRRSAIACGSR